MDKLILDVVHETASDLHESGAIDTMTMKKFDSLCLPPVKPLTPGEIKAIREKEHVSQAVFAAFLNASVSTIRQWEQGQKKPTGISLKILNLVASKGLSVLH